MGAKIGVWVVRRKQKDGRKMVKGKLSESGFSGLVDFRDRNG